MDITLKEKEIIELLNHVPDKYDKSEGGIFYDVLKPVSLGLGELVDFASSILDSRFLDSAEGDDLDRACAEFGVERKKAQYADGEVVFFGTKGALISAGALVASEAVHYFTKEDCTIGDDGTVTVAIICTVPGKIGNVGSGYVNKLPVSLAGVDSVTNESPILGGYEKETDEELRDRTYAKIRTPGTSGNKNDYINWAMSVDGVGGVRVKPLWDGNGTVKVVIVDSNGELAEPDLVSAVAEYIETVRPVGADVTVVSATEKTINVSAKIVFSSGYDEENVISEIGLAIKKHLQKFGLSGVAISVAKIGAAILNVEGVSDYTLLTVNDGTENIEISEDEIPILGAFTNVP